MNTGKSNRGLLLDWKPTPMLIHVRGEALEVEKSSYTRSIRAYLFYYGVEIPIDSKIEKELNEAVFSEGSFYAYRRSGVIVLIPRLERIIFMYRG